MTNGNRQRPAYKPVQYFLSHSVCIENPNIEGRRVQDADWRDLDAQDFNSYISLLIKAGVLKSHIESTEGLWNAQSGRSVFRAGMSLKNYTGIYRVIRFHNKQT